MLDPRRRFRDRLLIGMVAVALLPLAGFAILAAVDLDAISRSTANEAQGAILKDEQDRQLTTTQSRAGLLEARPTLETKHVRLSVIPGRPPTPTDPPDGCPFHPRCAFVEPACISAVPPLRQLAGAAFSACRLTEEIRDRLRPEGMAGRG